MIIDITRPIMPGMAVYPGNPEVDFHVVQEAGGNASGLTKLSFGSHTGTHIDAPSHVMFGAKGVDVYSVEQMIGSCKVVDLRNVENVITGDDIPGDCGERTLFVTSNSDSTLDVFDDDFVALDESAATALVRQGVRLVGLDALSVKKKGVRDNVHNIFIQAGVVILEGLWMPGIEAGDYELICLPLFLVGVDGAPARVVLRR